MEIAISLVGGGLIGFAITLAFHMKSKRDSEKEKRELNGKLQDLTRDNKYLTQCSRQALEEIRLLQSLIREQAARDTRAAIRNGLQALPLPVEVPQDTSCQTMCETVASTPAFSDAAYGLYDMPHHGHRFWITRNGSHGGGENVEID